MSDKSDNLDSLDSIQSEEWYKRQAQLLSKKWGERLDDFTLPCPLCSGRLQFEGARRNPLYEFAENEPGELNLLNLLTISFICDRCGYIAEFDAELFNPAYLAQLQGEERSKIAELSVKDFRVLVPITAEERTDTLLGMATAIAGVRQGDVIVLSVNANQTSIEHLKEKVQRFKPEIGDPAPVQILFNNATNVGDAIVETASQQKCNLLLIGWRGWTRNQQAVMGTVLDPVLKEASCDVAVIHDKGIPNIRRILLPLLDTSNDKVAAQLAYDIAQGFDAELHLEYITGLNTPENELRAKQLISQIVRTLPQKPTINIEEHLLVSNDAVQTIVSESASYDLVVLGSSTKRNFRRDNDVMKIARNCNPTAIVVKSQQQGVGAWFTRLLS